MQKKSLLILLCCLSLVLDACERRADAPAAENSKANTPTANQESNAAAFDVCGLIKSEELQAVQGSAIKETKGSGRSNAGFQTAQCFYLAAEFNKSVSLSVTRTDPNSASKANLKDFWKQTFGRSENQEKEEAADKEKKESLRQQREKGEEEGAAMKKIDGIGDDAYWSGTRVGGALYVLKRNAFIRISLGGPDSEDAKINKSKVLAQKAIDRL